MNWKTEYDAVLKSGMFWEWFPELSGEWEKDKDKFEEELMRYRNPSVSFGKPEQLDRSKFLRYDSSSKVDFAFDEAGRYKKPRGWVQLEIYHAEGYFVGEWRLEPETSGRRTLTKTGWKGVRDFVAKHKPEDFLVTYNGVKYDIEDNSTLFKKLFEDEI